VPRINTGCLQPRSPWGQEEAGLEGQMDSLNVCVFRGVQKGFLAEV
jgi:hypothetical protein